jgi:hypothetical protein
MAIPMVNGKTPAYLTLLALILTVAAVLTLQPYSADSTPYARPARGFIRAALRQDSMGLTRMAVSSSPVVWALAAARDHPDKLSQWAPRTEALVGELRGDTVQVFVYPTGDVCSTAPIRFRLVKVGKKVKVAQANSACLDAR